MKSGIFISDLHRLNKSSKAICKSEPITPGLKSSLMRLFGSRHLLFLRDLKTLSSSSEVQGGVLTSLQMLIILLKFSSFIFIICLIPGITGLFLSLIWYFLFMICLTAEVFVTIFLWWFFYYIWLFKTLLLLFSVMIGTVTPIRHTRATPPEIWNLADWRALVKDYSPEMAKIRE